MTYITPGDRPQSARSAAPLVRYVAVTRPTGTWTDHLRHAWRDRLARYKTLDHLAHRAYFHLSRLRYAIEFTPDVGEYLRVESRWAKPGPVSVRVRPLGGARAQLRPGTTDAISLRDTFRDLVHSPPPGIEDPKWIVDLGANIGLTIADNARRYPRARIVGVELDPGNAAIARANTRPWADRVEILQGAVWESDGEVPYEHEIGQEHGFRVTPEGATATTRALSPDTILAHVPADQRIDFVKMDIEGVEARLLSGAHARWTARIDSIALQVHDPYTLDACARDLAALGFTPEVVPRRMNFIQGIRRPAPG
jgi:FkbM family methyltransferase